jgi:hypothetical protein
MIVNLEHRPPFSVPEFWGGGIALATVALIAFGGLPFAQPQNSLPAPKRYASVSIPSSETLAKLSLERPGELSDVAAATPDVQSPDTRLDRGNAMPLEPNGAKAPLPSAADRQAAAAAGAPVGIPVQQRGIEADAPGAVTHRPIRFWTLGLPTVSDAMCPSRQVHAPTPALLEAGRTISAGAGPVEKRHSSSAPARQRQPAANALSDSWRERPQIDGGLQPFAPPREIFGEPISP